MDYVVIAILVLFFALAVLFGVRLARKGNYIALALLVPYLGMFTLRAAPWIHDQVVSGKKVLKIEDGRMLRDIGVAEAIGIARSSKVMFGGDSHPGGIITATDQMVGLLQKQGIAPHPGKALIWLKDSTASTAIVEWRLLFIPDWKAGQDGIWIGWIDASEVARIERMDAGG